MKIAFVTECDYSLTEDDIQGAELVLFPFYYKEVVNYSREIKGQSSFFKNIASLSKRLKTTVITGVDTDSYGFLRHSVAVCSYGKLLGISDMNVMRDGDKYTGGGNYRVFDTHAGKIGVAIGGDVYSSECIKALGLCGADIVACVCDPILDHTVTLSARAKAYEFGVPIAVCANKYAFLSDISGEIAFSSPKKISVVNAKIEKDFHLVTMRRRGKKQIKYR